MVCVCVLCALCVYLRVSVCGCIFCMCVCLSRIVCVHVSNVCAFSLWVSIVCVCTCIAGVYFVLLVCVCVCVCVWVQLTRPGMCSSGLMDGVHHSARMPTHTHTHTHTHVFYHSNHCYLEWLHAFLFECVRARACVYVHVCVHVHVWPCVCVCVWARTSLWMCGNGQNKLWHENKKQTVLQKMLSTHRSYDTFDSNGTQALLVLWNWIKRKNGVAISMRDGELITERKQYLKHHNKIPLNQRTNHSPYTSFCI